MNLVLAVSKMLKFSRKETDMKLLISVIISTYIFLQGGISPASLDPELPASCKVWESEVQSLEKSINLIDNDEFTLNAGIPGLMLYGVVISPFLAGADFLFGPEFRANIYENHRGISDFLMITTIPFVVFPYTVVLNTKTLVDKVAVKRFLQIRRSILIKKIGRNCLESVSTS